MRKQDNKETSNQIKGRKTFLMLKDTFYQCHRLKRNLMSNYYVI